LKDRKPSRVLAFGSDRCRTRKEFGLRKWRRKGEKGERWRTAERQCGERGRERNARERLIASGILSGGKREQKEERKSECIPE